MPRFTGTLTMNAGVSQLDGIPLVRAPLSGNPFGRATTFLRQDRNLTGGRIFVDGTEDFIGNQRVIVITDAGRALAARTGPAAGRALTASRGAKKGGTAAARRTSSSGESRANKGAAKKSAGKKGAAKRSAAKKRGAKKSAAKKSGGARSSRKSAAKKSTNKGTRK